MENSFNLFVYGTLKRNERANHFLQGCEFIGEAVSKDACFDMKSNNGYYPFIFTNGDSKVGGEIYKCPLNILPYLDSYEGYREDGDGLYLRGEFEYLLKDGTSIKAIMYYQNGALKEQYSKMIKPEGLEKGIEKYGDIFFWNS